MEGTSIGLDIGATAVRAAEVALSRDGRVLRRYAQVGLPSGAVVDGDIVNPQAVSSALRRLWSEGGFSSNKVVLGLSGHRVIVRQADVPALDEEDLRSALRFDAQELIPIPMENASFDFVVLDRRGPDADGKSTMRILIAAAHRDQLRSHLSTLKASGLEATTVEPTPLALMRVVPPTPGGGGSGEPEALVAIGAELTTVAVRQDGVPRFIRSLGVGGSKMTAGLANALHVDAAVAERLKRGGAPVGAPGLAQMDRAMSAEVRDLVEDVRATVDFFAAQADGGVIDRVLITGGASLTNGLAEALAGNTTMTVTRVDPFATLRLEPLGLSQSDLERARASAGTAVGLALWPAQAEATRLSILPDDVAIARRNRRMMAVAGTGVAVIAAFLGVAGVGQYLAVHHARAQVASAERQVTALQTQVNSLQAKTIVHQQVLARTLMVTASLQGDINWVGVLQKLEASMPPGVSISSFQGTRAAAPTGGSGASSSAVSSPAIGSVSVSVAGQGGLPTVAAWLDGLQRDHALAATWVQGITVAGSNSTVTFSSLSDLTKYALSNRAETVKP